MYTDGLVERRGQALDEGLLRLRAAMAELAGATLDDLCDGVLAADAAEQPEDDVALVAVRLHRLDRPRPAEAGPVRVPGDLPPVRGLSPRGVLRAGAHGPVLTGRCPRAGRLAGRRVRCP